MDNLKVVSVNVSENCDYAKVCVDLPLSTETSLGSERLQPEPNMMNNEEIDLALSCAKNIQKHLTRVLQLQNEAKLENKLHYVNGIIQECGLRSQAN